MMIAGSRRPVQLERSGASSSGSEVGDERACVAFGPDLQDPLDRRGVFWVAQHAVPVEGADRGQAGVAGPGAAPVVGFEVVEERAVSGASSWLSSRLDGSTPSFWDAAGLLQSWPPDAGVNQ